MPKFECAICTESIINALICNNCKKLHDVSAPWAKALIREEMDWRNTNRRDDEHGLKPLSDYLIQSEEGNTDGWEIVYTDQTINLSPVITLSEMEQIDSLIETIEDYHRREQARIILNVMSKKANLTPGEMNALNVYLTFNEKISSKQAAVYLTDVEGKPIRAEAYRRRVSDLKRKLNRVDPNWLYDYLNTP